MFQTILVPLDGSPRAEAALPVAARLAQNAGSGLVLVRVVSCASEYWPAIATANPLLAQALFDTNVAEATAYLERIASSAALAGISRKTVVQCGHPAATILSVADSSQSDLIVLCSHGRTGLQRWALGRVAQKVAHHSAIPVLLLREGTDMPTDLHSEGQQPVRVMVALDGSPLAEAAISPAAQLSCALSAPRAAKLHLVQVVPLEDPLHVTEISRESQQHYEISPKEQEQAITAARAYLYDVQQRLQEETRALQITSSVIVNPDVAATLMEAAEANAEEGAEPKIPERANRYDVMALATHGRSGLARWVMGSITERILGATRLPLLIVRSPQQAGEPLVRQEGSPEATI